MATNPLAKAERYMDQRMTEPARLAAVARNLYGHVTNIGRGKRSLDYDKIGEMGPAYVDYLGPNESMKRDSTTLTGESLKLPYIYRPYKIERPDIDAFAREGKDLPAADMASAMYQVLAQEEIVLLKGWAPDGTNYLTDGLYRAAGNQYTEAKDFGTYGNAQDAVAEALALIWKDKIYGPNYTLVLATEQYAKLFKSRSGNDQKEWGQVLEILNYNPGAPKGGIVMAHPDALDDGTALLVPVEGNGTFIDLIVSEDAHNVLGFDSKLGQDSPAYGHVMECLAGKVAVPDALCRMTNIGSGED